MRRVPAELALAMVVSSVAANPGTHIDAPVPPYCNPRGNWAECVPESQETSIIEYSTDEVSEIAEFHPFVRQKSDRAMGVAGGYAKLILRWVEDEPQPSATIAVVSSRVLTLKAATELAKRFARNLDQEGVVAVGIERFAWPWQRDRRADWCELSRGAKAQAWNVECGAE
jgi:hypothetical protein